MLPVEGRSPADIVNDAWNNLLQIDVVAMADGSSRDFQAQLGGILLGRARGLLMAVAATPLRALELSSRMNPFDFWTSHAAKDLRPYLGGVVRMMLDVPGSTGQLEGAFSSLTVQTAGGHRGSLTAENLERLGFLHRLLRGEAAVQRAKDHAFEAGNGSCGPLDDGATKRQCCGGDHQRRPATARRSNRWEACTGRGRRAVR